MTRGLRRTLARVWRDERGSTAIEFALIAPVFVTLVLATLQLAVIYIAKTELMSATQTAARLVFTGQTSTTYTTAASFKTALCANLPVIIQCSGVMINLAPQASLSAVSTASPTLTYNANGTVSNNFTFNAGTNNQIMVLQALYQLPVVSGPLFDFST